jgi:hypothetical protein
MPQVDDLSRSLVAFDQDASLIVVVEMSEASWLVAGIRAARSSRRKAAPSGCARAMTQARCCRSAPSPRNTTLAGPIDQQLQPGHGGAQSLGETQRGSGREVAHMRQGGVSQLGGRRGTAVREAAPGRLDSPSRDGAHAVHGNAALGRRPCSGQITSRTDGLSSRPRRRRARPARPWSCPCSRFWTT